MHISVDDSIHTSRLELRLINNDHLNEFCEMIRHSPSLHQWVDWCHPHFNQQDGYDFLIANRVNWLKSLSYGFGVFLKHNDELIGMVALTERYYSFNMGTIGYWISDEHQRKGYASEALQGLCSFCFEEIALTRLEIVCDTENIASHAVAKKLGALEEGVARNRFIHDDQIRDGLVFSLIPSDLA